MTLKSITGRPLLIEVRDELGLKRAERVHHIIPKAGEPECPLCGQRGSHLPFCPRRLKEAA